MSAGTEMHAVRFLRYAYELAAYSPDPSTQNGAVLVDTWTGVIIGRGYNDLPSGVNDTPERWERPLKYELVEHAERNAIYDAARAGRATRGATLYCAWAACADCARAIIQAGLKRLVRHQDATERGAGRTWDGTISIADQMLQEAGVEITDVAGKLTTLSLRHSGELWSP